MAKNYNITLVHVKNTTVFLWYMAKNHNITLVHVQNTMVLFWYISKCHKKHYFGTSKWYNIALVHVQKNMILPWYILKSMILPWYMFKSFCIILYFWYFVKTKYARHIRLNGHIQWSTVVIRASQTNTTMNSPHAQKRACVMETQFIWTVPIGWALPSADWSNTLHCTGP